MEPRIKERKVRVARSAGRKRLRVILAMLIVIGLGVGVIELLHSSFFSAHHIDVTGLSHTTRMQVIDAADLESEPALIDINDASVAAAIERLPWVGRATVKKSWPTTVHIAITERAPIGQIQLSHSRFAIVDLTGRVLADETAPSASLMNLHDIKSVPGPGGYVAQSARGIVTTAGATPTGLVNQVSYVGTTPNDGIVLGLKDGLTVIFATATDLRQKMVSLATVLSPTSSVSLAGIVTIDLRVPSSPVLTR